MLAVVRMTLGNHTRATTHAGPFTDCKFRLWTLSITMGHHGEPCVCGQLR